MAKFCLKKKSKRIQASTRYKIEKKVREHNRKVRKEAKKNVKGKKKRVITVPNNCPFKAQILQEAADYKKKLEEERLKQREMWKAAAKQEIKEESNHESLAGLVANARAKQSLHDQFRDEPVEQSELKVKEKSDGSVKAYYKEFKKVIEAADVVLEVVDARDPMGTRCKQVEKAVMESPARKRLIIVVNKADLVPRDNLEKWLKVLRGSFPTVAFKASTQNQARALGHRKMRKRKHKFAGEELQVSSCVGAELLLSLLGNYCRNNGIKTAIRVGVVGLPNVGKSSIINSLKRSRACNVGATPGVTKSMQEVQLDSKIKLLDSPGVVFATSKCQNEGSYALKNAIRVTTVDPIPAATAILQRCTKRQLMDLYCLPEYNTSEEFFALKAQRQGKVKKGGVVDINAAARGLVDDWNCGKIRYYTVPPESDNSEMSSAIVAQMSKEFDLDSYIQMEVDMLRDLPESYSNCPAEPVKSGGPVDVVDSMETDSKPGSDLLPDNIAIEEAGKSYKKRAKNKPSKKKQEKQGKIGEDALIDKQLLLPGNERKAKKCLKMLAKKEKKMQRRTDKKLTAVTDVLDNFSL